MSRIPLMQLDEMTRDQRAQYDRFPSNLTRGLLLADQRLASALPELANALRASSLEARLREAVVLRVAALEHSAYERMQHLEQAKANGWTEEDIAAIEAGEPPAEIIDVMHFVDECVATGDISDAVFGATLARLGARHIVELLLLIGHYMMVARFAAVLRIELDARPDSWTHEH